MLPVTGRDRPARTGVAGTPPELGAAGARPGHGRLAGRVPLRPDHGRPDDPAAVQPERVSSAASAAAPAPADPKQASKPKRRGKKLAPPRQGLRPGAGAVGAAPGRARSAATGSRPRPARRRLLRRPRTYVIAGCLVVSGAAGAFYLMPASSQAHAISVPRQLPGYVLEPSMVASAGASALRSQLVASSGGEATRVVDAVYEDTAGAGGQSVPQIVVFVGGHLAGSASSFINGLTQALPGAFTIRPGVLQGQAACAPGRPGRPAECVWADNDTFGVLVSPGLTTAALSNELRQMRPFIEHVVK